jgi:hypothetical protein
MTEDLRRRHPAKNWRLPLNPLLSLADDLLPAPSTVIRVDHPMNTERADVDVASS